MCATENTNTCTYALCFTHTNTYINTILAIKSSHNIRVGWNNRMLAVYLRLIVVQILDETLDEQKTGKPHAHTRRKKMIQSHTIFDKHSLHEYWSWTHQCHCIIPFVHHHNKADPLNANSWRPLFTSTEYIQNPRTTKDAQTQTITDIHTHTNTQTDTRTHTNCFQNMINFVQLGRTNLMFPTSVRQIHSLFWY